jgi:N-acetylneuraminic acid mutarotase
MNRTRYFHTASVLTDGKVLVTGGDTDIGYVNSAELYDPSTGTWTNTGNMSSARYQHTASVLTNGKVLATGGYIGTNLNSAELYDPSTGTWTTTGNMSSARYSHTASLLTNGKVLVTGGFHLGYGPGYQNSAELYDLSTGTWTTTGNMSSARAGHTASVFTNGKVLVTGGSNGSYLNSADLYDPSTGTWTNTDNMVSPRSAHTASILANEKILVAGGLNYVAYLNSAELY